MKDLQKFIIAIVFAVSVFFYVLDKGELPKDINQFSDQVQKSEKIEGSTDMMMGEYSVARIIDGDTFDLTSGERVRMIGIDTPERGKKYYAEATDRLRELIGGKVVRLEKDHSEVDRYGRLLRHVYIGDMWINKKMIDEGYARFVTFPPDVVHVPIFTVAEQNARNAKKGLWAEDVLR